MIPMNQMELCRSEPLADDNYVRRREYIERHSDGADTVVEPDNLQTTHEEHNRSTFEV
jgi:hypothetical protein